MVRFATKEERLYHKKRLKHADSSISIPLGNELWFYRDDDNDITVLITHYDQSHLIEVCLQYSADSLVNVSDQPIKALNTLSKIDSFMDPKNSKVYRRMTFARDYQKNNEPKARALVEILDFYQKIIKEGFRLKNELEKNFEVMGNLTDIIYGHLGYTKPLELKPR